MYTHVRSLKKVFRHLNTNTAEDLLRDTHSHGWLYHVLIHFYSWNIQTFLCILPPTEQHFTDLQFSDVTLTYICIYIRGEYDMFPILFSYGHSWDFSTLLSNLLRLQCSCCTVRITIGRPHGSPLVWPFQWPLSQPLSSPQLSHNDSLWA